MKTIEQLEEEIGTLKQAVRQRIKTDARHRSDPALRLMRHRLRRTQRRRRAILIREGKLVIVKKPAAPAAPKAQKAEKPPPKAP